MTDKRPLIIIAGPTASNKTATGVNLAKILGGEIISADSMQIYRGMDIGTAKPTMAERQDITHHLMDVAEPDQNYSVYDFAKEARAAIDDISNRGKWPILVGGTGFYINALIKSNEFTEMETDNDYREELWDIARKEGPMVLYERLMAVDPGSEVIHPNNVKRVIRALEYFRLTGEPISSHNKRERGRGLCYDCHSFVLHMDRDMLYQRIEARVDKMMDQGLLDEARYFYERFDRGLPSMQGIGYKELFEHFDGRVSLPEAVDHIKLNSRHLAKRQFTWFRRQLEGIWLDVGALTETDLVKACLGSIKGGD